MSNGNTPSAPPRSFAFSACVFLRLLAVIHLIAFASAWSQIAGLVGPRGILPANDYFAAAHQQLGASAWWELPSLCWIFGTGAFLPWLCLGGIVVSLLLFAGIAPSLCLAALWLAYLSLITAGQIFFGFQWDGLLLETTLLAVLVAPWKWLPLWRPIEPPALARYLVWWLLFRLMFFAGVVKLASGDPTWRNLTALTFHYETQPLPTPLAWYAHQLPLGWHKLECAAMFVIELGVPFLLVAPRPWRHAAAFVLAGFMAAIAATGNYTFFNALAITLCLFCLDDECWAGVLRFTLPASRPSADIPADAGRTGSADYPVSATVRRRPVRLLFLRAFAIFTFGYTGVLSALVFVPVLARLPGFADLAQLVEPLRSFNSYGLFAVMTHPRTELIFEGSDDGQNWREYGFPDKPGDLAARPKFVAPLQPRLDWQLWFATLEPADQNPWVVSLCEHLLRGTPEVLRLVANNPFGKAPPHYLRVLRYEYHFTDAAVRAATGHWWRRTPLEVYLPPMSLTTAPQTAPSASAACTPHAGLPVSSRMRPELRGKPQRISQPAQRPPVAADRPGARLPGTFPFAPPAAFCGHWPECHPPLATASSKCSAPRCRREHS